MAEKMNAFQLREKLLKETTDKLVEMVQNNTAPWQKPWEPGNASSRAINASTGKPYRGINAMTLDMSLAMDGQTDPRFCTYKQAKDMGAQVQKGAKSHLIEFWKFDKTVNKKDENGKPVLGEDGKPEKQRVRLEVPKVYFNTVFHASDIEGLPEYEPPAPLNETERHERCEAILANSGAVIHHYEMDRAFYQPRTDEIHLPTPEQFKAPDSYYATALHELGHWTGHESRLNRSFENNTGFGSPGYAREELRAEITSYMMGRDLEIGHDPSQHAAYLQSWIQVLEDNPKEIATACSDAQKACDFIYTLENERLASRDEAAISKDEVSEKLTEIKRSQEKVSENEDER